MARQKKVIKAKEPVKLRYKVLANGNQSIYLDIYCDGVRTYEFLKMYLVPGTSSAIKEKNEATIRAAEAIKNRRVVDLQNAKAGLSRPKNLMKCVSLYAFLEEYREDRKRKYLAKHRDEDNAVSERANAITKLIRHLKIYHPEDIKMANVDKEFCLGFLKYLASARDLRYCEDDEKKVNKKRSKNENDKSKKTRKDVPIISAQSQHEYFGSLNSAFKLAFKKDYINANPIDKILREDWPKPEQKKRSYLTIEEIKKLQETPCYDQNTKNAFLFSCFCGLRLSDVRRLTWKNVLIVGTGDKKMWSISMRMKKTGSLINIPLTKNAMQYLPERTDDEKEVFTLKSINQIEQHIAWWVRDAGIDKHVTMHVSRHSYATTLLTLGAPIETISKLLGHAHISTTEIYAEVIDEKKNEAVNLLDNAF